ncbi:unnamed protein product [Vicia faba]|uniref:glycerophosphodiester phosphodiesterase n=1 Tax=Vicia faba TaxID=3906 RepID=A0AAV0ZRY5_VICFA|nr:unnamed protein product [Vicia faba]
MLYYKLQNIIQSNKVIKAGRSITFSVITSCYNTGKKTPTLWLNIQYDAFFRQHKLNMKSIILSVSKKFLDKNGTDPSTNQTYGSLLKKLTFIKTFAYGIPIPKGYIWTVEASYLPPHTSTVTDTHKVRLEVYAPGCSNDDSLSFNYSYDPLDEYLQFIDDGTFSINGVLSDNPVTPSAAIG